MRRVRAAASMESGGLEEGATVGAVAAGCRVGLRVSEVDSMGVANLTDFLGLSLCGRILGVEVGVGAESAVSLKGGRLSLQFEQSRTSHVGFSHRHEEVLLDMLARHWKQISCPAALLRMSMWEHLQVRKTVSR